MIVLDASALVDVVADRRTRDWVLTALGEGDVHAPAHQPAEVLSAVARLERAGDLTAGGAAAAIDEALRLPQQLHALERGLVRRAFELRGHLRVLDALYVALADHLDAELVTTDTRLSRADLPCRVRTPPD